MWDSTVNKAYRVKGEVQPLQNAAADGVRKDIAAFGAEVYGARSSYFMFDCFHTVGVK